MPLIHTDSVDESENLSRGIPLVTNSTWICLYFRWIFFKIHRIRLANHHHGTNHQLRENVFGYFLMFASKNHKSASNWAMKKHLGCSGYIGDEILVSCVGIILIVRVNRG